MNQYFGNYPGAQSEGERWKNEAGRIEPNSFQAADAKVRVNAEFDRLSRSIAARAEWNTGLNAREVALLLQIVEQKRSEELIAQISTEWIEAWQSNSRARSILLTDARAANIYKTCDARRQAAVERPVRYFGFVDQGGCRVFQFGRLPETDRSTKYRVSVSLAFFAHKKLVLQDGPGFCASILAGCDEPNDYVATLADVDDFLASRPRGGTDKTRPRYDAREKH